ncbi:MAG TPA: GNAT family N-acetyltransferase [Sphingomonas sp.]|uniref:GNAT family N-acetyltransferase n=1 Tax=Sphingomonas sp. TaxID=28214 RepID=UPI002C194FB0|nr:GNAT family N-acetyltransferase [Sphingomonas sp.]HMI21142.1 GNAT family N-acetyltransferase [Sphingomonas sp.]
MPDITIRDIARADHRQWLPLWDGYNEFYGRSGATALPETISETLWERFFDPAEPVHGIVAEDEGRLIGLAHFLFHRSTTMIGPICYLQDIFTGAEARGRGVGQALIRAVYDRAEAAGAARVHWHTHETNLTARSLYDRVAECSGFIVYRKDL